MKVMAFVLIFNLMLATDFTGSDFGGLQVIGHALERFGVPVVFSLLIFKYFSNQVNRRHEEQREFWQANNAYLRELVKTCQDNYCEYKAEHCGKKENGI